MWGNRHGTLLKKYKAPTVLTEGEPVAQTSGWACEAHLTYTLQDVSHPNSKWEGRHFYRWDSVGRDRDTLRTVPGHKCLPSVISKIIFLFPWHLEEEKEYSQHLVYFTKHYHGVLQYFCSGDCTNTASLRTFCNNGWAELNYYRPLNEERACWAASYQRPGGTNLPSEDNVSDQKNPQVFQTIMACPSSLTREILPSAL